MMQLNIVYSIGVFGNRQLYFVYEMDSEERVDNEEEELD